jgi:hydroxymethylpyrimidine pyrophosphatase-like HAD family hydrolase
MIYNGAFFCDLDGTLAKSDGYISPQDKAAFEMLKDNNILRVIVTGRSPYSADKVIDSSFPIDYLVCSTGCAVFKWPEKDLIEKHGLTKDEANLAATAFRKRKIDFMVLDEVPQNHRFSAHVFNEVHPDMQRRIDLYDGHVKRANYDSPAKGGACQLIGVVSEGVDIMDELSNELDGMKVLRATSPLDGKSVWIEIYPKHISKGSVAKNICENAKVDFNKTAGIGNDYNDLDLLEFVRNPYVVSNAPESMKLRYGTVSKCGENGVKEAAEDFLTKLKQRE